MGVNAEGKTEQIDGKSGELQSVHVRIRMDGKVNANREMKASRPDMGRQSIKRKR